MPKIVSPQDSHHSKARQDQFAWRAVMLYSPMAGIFLVTASGWQTGPRLPGSRDATIVPDSAEIASPLWASQRKMCPRRVRQPYMLPYLIAPDPWRPASWPAGLGDEELEGGHESDVGTYLTNRTYVGPWWLVAIKGLSTHGQALSTDILALCVQ